MNREVHVRFWEGLGVRFHRATQLALRTVELHSPVDGDAHLNGEGHKSRSYCH